MDSRGVEQQPHHCQVATFSYKKESRSRKQMIANSPAAGSFGSISMQNSLLKRDAVGCSRSSKCRTCPTTTCKLEWGVAVDSDVWICASLEQDLDHLWQ